MPKEKKKQNSLKISAEDICIIEESYTEALNWLASLSDSVTADSLPQDIKKVIRQTVLNSYLIGKRQMYFDMANDGLITFAPYHKVHLNKVVELIDSAKTDFENGSKGI